MTAFVVDVDDVVVVVPGVEVGIGVLGIAEVVAVATKAPILVAVC